MRRRKFLSTCSDPTCPELVESGRCPRHQREWFQSVGWVYRDPRWQDLRAQVREEQPTCARLGCGRPWTDLDHKVAVRHGGAPFDRQNVHGLCVSHHSQKTREEAL